MSIASEDRPIEPQRVSLVAAGPGDPELITLAAVRRLAAADVVLYDALANDRLLQHTQADCERISVGKHGCGPVWRQEEICAEIERHWRLGRRVVRLKGGDTSIFARTAEECEYLAARGIAFEVVPGVTSASAVAAYAGIPLTHRDWASGVALLTGHAATTDSGEEGDPDVDWAALAAFPGTLVLYMAVTNVRRWAGELMAAGKSPTTPVAVVRHASLPQQQVWRTQLDEVANLIEGPPKLRPPVLFIVGEVAGLPDTLDWFTRRPLHGHFVVLTRPPGHNEELAGQLEELGAEVSIRPVLTPIAGDALTEELTAQAQSAKWIVFSSVHGVHYFMRALEARQLDARNLPNCLFAGVGPSIAAALRSYHLRSDLCLDSTGDGAALAEILASQITNDDVVFDVTTEHSRGELRRRLREHCQYVPWIAYRMKPTTVEPFIWPIGKKKIWVTATSVAIAEEAWRRFGAFPEVCWIALRERVAERLRELGAVHIEQIEHVDQLAEIIGTERAT